MADNPEKRELCNRAITILNAGRTTNSGVLFTDIDDTEFADFSTVSEANNADKRLICFNYEPILKMVIEDMAPSSSVRYADLGREVAVNSEFGGWDYLFEFPSDYVAMLAQVAEGNRKHEFDSEPLTFENYSHVVAGADGSDYLCGTSHTSVDDSSDGQPSDNDGNVNWSVMAADSDRNRAQWYAGVAYKTAASGQLLASNSFSNDNGTSAYIKYLAYIQAAFGDIPARYTEGFKNAFATRLAAEMALDGKDYQRRTALLTEYEILAKPHARAMIQRPNFTKPHRTVFQSRLGGRSCVTGCACSYCSPRQYC